jgi:hypothetical protein
MQFKSELFSVTRVNIQGKRINLVLHIYKIIYPLRLNYVINMHQRKVESCRVGNITDPFGCPIVFFDLISGWA